MNTKKKQGYSSLEKTEDSKPWEFDRNQAIDLLPELEGENWKGTLEYWMACRIDELLEREKSLKDGPAKERCRKECSELIRQLRTSYQEKNSGSLWNSINRNLRNLIGSGDGWFERGRETINLADPCAINDLTDDDLLCRLLAIHDEQREIILLLGTDELVENGIEESNLDAETFSKFMTLRNGLFKIPEPPKWKDDLHQAKDRKTRMNILDKQARFLSDQSTQVWETIISRSRT